MKRDRQTGLPLDRNQKIKVLKAIDYRSLRPEVSKSQWANALDLLIQVTCCSGRDGTNAALTTLAGRMRERIGLSVRTAQRAIQLSQSLGLLSVESYVGRASVYRIAWDRAVALSRLDLATMGAPQPSLPNPLDGPMGADGIESEAMTDPCQSVVDPRQVVANPRQVVADPRQNGGPYIRNSLSNLPIASEDPPPPSPSDANDGWAAEEEELLRLGVKSATAAVCAAKTAGCRIDEWREHRRYWSEHRGSWKSPLGVLAHRLKSLRPGQPPDEGWPPIEDRQAAAERSRVERELYDRRHAARSQWRGWDSNRKIEVLCRAGMRRHQAIALVTDHPSEAERRGVPYVAERLTPARVP